MKPLLQEEITEIAIFFKKAPCFNLCLCLCCGDWQGAAKRKLQKAELLFITKNLTPIIFILYGKDL